jgi:peptidoglycan/xylan/chitin deacetylase (PgdA/CDA1 family)
MRWKVPSFSKRVLQKKFAKTLAYRAGVLPAYHLLRNKDTLTVVTFHRVMPATERDSSGADPLWTMSTELFEAVLSFLVRHYNPVTLNDVLASRMGGKALPRRAILVTFDDGWRDNLDYAYPLLRRFGVPAALFTTTEILDEKSVCWWQEVLLWALRTGRRTVRELNPDSRENEASADAQTAPELELLLRYSELGSSRRTELLEPLASELERRQVRAQMLDSDSLSELAAAGVEIGVHGTAHLPLTALANPADDLARSRAKIALCTKTAQTVSLSFPHGRYDQRVLDAARGLGFKLLFSSDAIVNPCPGGWLHSDIIGRIPIYPDAIVESGEQLSDPELATWLFRRSHRLTI